MQETCVTVTLMKFFYQVHLLTGDSKYVDAFEISLYNAYLGAINTEKVIEPLIKAQHPDWNIEPLPFDSYSPLTAGTRGNGIGMGDVKLMAAAGLLLGWPNMILATLVGSLTGSVIHLWRMRRGAGRKLAFGPYLAFGLWVSVLFGPGLISAYLGLFGL